MKEIIPKRREEFKWRIPPGARVGFPMTSLENFTRNLKPRLILRLAFQPLSGSAGFSRLDFAEFETLPASRLGIAKFGSSDFSV